MEKYRYLCTIQVIMNNAGNNAQSSYQCFLQVLLCIMQDQITNAQSNVQIQYQCTYDAVHDVGISVQYWYYVQ